MVILYSTSHGLEHFGIVWYMLLPFGIKKKKKSCHYYGGISLHPTCKSNHLNMQHDFVHMQENYVNMRDEYVNM